jgi:hypothetical protein
VWEVPLVNKLQSMAELARAEARPQELLIWSEQEDLARRTVEALGLGIEVITDENSAADAGDEGDEAVQPGGHYRTIRIVC